MNETAPMYYLSEHAHLCVGKRRVVILDLASGMYFGLQLSDAQKLSSWVCGWPVSAGSSDGEVIVRQLHEARLLTTDSRQGRLVLSTADFAQPVESLLDRATTRVLTVQSHHVFQFLKATTLARLHLRVLGLRRIVQRLRAKAHAPSAQEANLDEIQALVSIFRQLYPWIGSSKNACLRKSLALLYFLRPFGFSADWVFAVRDDPFFAHCWLQHRNIVLNDTLRATAWLTPIFVVRSL